MHIYHGQQHTCVWHADTIFSTHVYHVFFLHVTGGDAGLCSTWRRFESERNASAGTRPQALKARHYSSSVVCKVLYWSIKQQPSSKQAALKCPSSSHHWHVTSSLSHLRHIRVGVSSGPCDATSTHGTADCDSTGSMGEPTPCCAAGCSF